ncbi:hypothetical protein ACF044_18385 [Microbacterium sp. NPDC016588]
MTDLTTLFPSAGEWNERLLVSSAGAAQLRELVGGGTDDAAPRASSSSSSQSLAMLVGEPKQERVTASTSPLSSLWGGSAPEIVGSRPATKGASLSVLVGEPEATVLGAGWAAPETAQVGRRPILGTRRRQGPVNFISIAAATLAVIALAGTTTFAVVQRVTANPADGAMVSLREQEAELQNATAVLQTSADLYSGSLTEASAMVESGAGPLAALRGRAEQAPIDVAESARTALAQTVATPETVKIPVYVREAIDEKSLTDVGRAIDDVRAARSAIPPLVDAARTARTTVVSAMDTYRAALLSLGAAIEAEVPKQLQANDAASDTFGGAVTAAAERIRAAQAAGSDGVSEMPAYAAAVDALRAENQRILALRQAVGDTEEDAPRRTQQSPTLSVPDLPDPQPSTPSETTPTDPPAPTPDPDPSESPSPDPVSTPDPAPVDPSVDGSASRTS